MLLILLGALLGWVASRLVIPTPALAHVSPRVQVGGPVLVSVPFAENVRWLVQGGEDKWCSGHGWSRTKRWITGPGEALCPESKNGIRIVTEGFGKDAGLAGATIQAVKVEPSKKEE